MYLNRELEETLKRYLRIFPVVALTGPRQSGKSTMLLHLLESDYRYVSFDEHRITSVFYDDPEKFMTIYSDKVIFDEAQKVPEIFDYLKIAVDHDRDRYGKFIISGSSQFLLLKKVTESLAGRIGLLTLLPFQYSEVPAELREQSFFQGSFPEMVTRKYEYWREWYAAYIDTYIQKDLRQLSNIGDLHDFTRFLSLLASRTAQLLNLSNYARDLGVSVSTIKRWLSILEASYIIFLLPPFYQNFGKRIVKSPKLYFYDVGIVSYLTGISTREMFENGPMAGSIFENYIIAEIMKKELHQDSKAQFYFLRTSHGDEIDLIVDRKQSHEFIEIKNSHTFRPQMARTLKKTLATQQMGYLVYRGKNMPYGEPVSIINYADFLAKTKK